MLDHRGRGIKAGAGGPISLVALSAGRPALTPRYPSPATRRARDP